jgi:hypothetical protein
MNEVYFWFYALMELAKVADKLVPLFLSAAVLIAFMAVFLLFLREGGSK